MTKELDATPILDEFVYEHPDFSLNGAKAIFSLTGYCGILGYRTQDDRDIAADSPDRPAFDAYRASEIEAVKPVIERHEFDVEIIAAENVLEFAGGTQRVIELAQAQTSLDDARREIGRAHV